MIKNGFLIKDNKIYDTKIQSYSLKKEILGDNIIFYMQPNGYKRLYLFEVLLGYYDIYTVFDMLAHNSFLKKNRMTEQLIKHDKTHYISNMSSIYNYPPTYLTRKRFSIYKICQKLKRKLD